MAAKGEEYRSIDGGVLRTITEFSEIGDVGPVTHPVWEETISAARSRDAFLEEQKQSEAPVQDEDWEVDARERTLELAEKYG